MTQTAIQTVVLFSFACHFQCVLVIDHGGFLVPQGNLNVALYLVSAIIQIDSIGNLQTTWSRFARCWQRARL
jgi:hypothetical protein